MTDSYTTEDWIKAKEVLKKEIIDGRLPPEMTASSVYASRKDDLFSKVPWNRFRDNLRSLRRRLEENKERAITHAAAFAHDQEMYPTLQHPLGAREPRWDGSKAQATLKQAGRKKKKRQPVIKPTRPLSASEFYASRLAGGSSDEDD